ncbi:MutT/nudix family protein, partial [Pseudomonas syringae pv. antirrhini]
MPNQKPRPACRGFCIQALETPAPHRLQAEDQPMTWQAHVTVATIVEDQGRFLFVEEMKGGRAVLNQPAGHLDPNESLQCAAVRETLEETGWDVELTSVVGIYLYTAPSNGVTYQRICFAAKALRHNCEYQLDHGILGAIWLTRDE